MPGGNAHSVLWLWCARSSRIAVDRFLLTFTKSHGKVCHGHMPWLGPEEAISIQRCDSAPINHCCFLTCCWKPLAMGFPLFPLVLGPGPPEPPLSVIPSSGSPMPVRAGQTPFSHKFWQCFVPVLWLLLLQIHETHDWCLTDPPGLPPLNHDREEWMRLLCALDSF